MDDPNPLKYSSYLIAFVSSLPYLCILSSCIWLSDNFRDCIYQNEKCIVKPNECHFTACFPPFPYSVVDRKEIIWLNIIPYLPQFNVLLLIINF